MPPTAQHPALQRLYERHRQVAARLVKKHKAVRQFIKAATLSGTLLLTQPVQQQLPPGTVQQELKRVGYRNPEETRSVLAEELGRLLPGSPGRVSEQNAPQVGDLVWKLFGIRVTQELEGYKLNHSFGWMGYEQHLKRFPGDTLESHGIALEAGMAPGLGAWGYFAPNQTAMTEEVMLRERYYVAVQTLYTPEWNLMTYKQREWYKYRKVVVINPQNGKAIVADIGDAGPAQWTGKQFGGSPALMQYLDLDRGPRKGKVLLWFVDGNAPLGPIEYRQDIGKPISV